jgi:hypothetical protein
MSLTTLAHPALHTSAPPAENPEPTGLHPPRYWWLRRLGLASVVLALGLAGLRVAWGREAKRRLVRELEPILARGEPVSGPMVNATAVPDGGNGALVYRQAMAAIGADSPAASSMNYNGFPPYPPRWHKMADQSVATNAEMFRLARLAREYDRFDWGTRVGTPATMVMVPHLNRMRHLANLLGDAALHAHFHGDDFESLERIRDVRHAASAVGAAPDFLVTYLVHVGLQGIALHRLEIIAPGLTIAPDVDDDRRSRPETTQPTARPAARAQVRALIADLLDEREQREMLRRAFVTERAAQLDLAEWSARNVPLLRPMFELDAVGLARANTALVGITEVPNSQALKQAVQSQPLLPQSPQTAALAPGGAKGAFAKRPPIDYTRLLTTDAGSATMWRAIDQDLRVRMERRLVAMSLAIQLYRADHHGQFPPAADALVPKYLPQVPTDPAAADGRPLKYVIFRGGLPDGGDRPIIYSVGTDGRDDTVDWGGDKSRLPNFPQFGDYRPADQWRDVSRWTPPAMQQTPEEDLQDEAAMKP